MKSSSIYFAIRILSVAVAATLGVSTPSDAQAGRQDTQVSSATDAMQTELHSLTDIQTQNPGLDQKQFADYKRFYNESAEPAKKIELGKAFLQKYPKSSLTEAVEAGLVDAYIARQDWPNVYSTAASALVLKPDDIDILATVGWVIPHFYHPDDPDSDSLLNKAETYEKHALDVLATMPKPARVTDAQFAAMKAQKSLQVHSALGLVYFRRDDYEASAEELQKATQGNANADQSDLFVLGIDQQNLKHYIDAVDAYSRCAQIPGGLADQCKQGADQSRRLAQIK